MNLTTAGKDSFGTSFDPFSADCGLEVGQLLSTSDSLAQTRDLISSVKDVKDKLSSYETCTSASSEEDSDNCSPPKPRGFKRKPGRMTPVKTDNGKKANLDVVSLDWEQY